MADKLEVSVKQSLDELFSNVNFNKKLYKEIQIYNLDFITKNEEQKSLFSGQLIGCYKVRFTLYDQENFFSTLFGISSDQVYEAIDKITTINKSFKISTEPINLICIYVVHRFMTNSELSHSDRELYAKEILNFFNYRTLVVICSNFFVYPISEQEAITLFERLSYKYLIKNIKNWNEYCKYRSNEYIKSAYCKIVIKLEDDDALPNAINDIYLRTKDTIKNIYGEFVYIKQNEENISLRRSTITDLEGKEVLSDKLDTADSYYTYVLSTLIEKEQFIKKDLIEITMSIIKNADRKNFEKLLEYFVEYSYSNKGNYEKSVKIIHDLLVYIVNYLVSNRNTLNKNIVETLSKVTGVVLYSRSTDRSLNDLKDEIDILIKDVYLEVPKTIIPNRRIMDLRNAFIIYVCLRSFSKKLD